MYALTNSRIYTGNKILTNHALIISNGFINNILPMKYLSKKIIQHDLSGNILAPGFIDLQLNGCGGVQFNDNVNNISINTLKIMQTTNQKFGCTSFLPTLITSSDILIKQAIKIIRIFLLKNKNQALGLHLEGPYINPKKKGIHNPLFIRFPTEEMIAFLCDNNDIVKKITLAPEQVKQSIIYRLCKSGIQISVGHSNATYEQTKKGFNAGINFVTHLFNAMPPLTAREPGIIGAVFDTPTIYCSIITDGIHVHWANVRNAKHIKTDHLILVTDATSPAGTNNNIKTFTFAGKTIKHHNGLCVDQHGILSGSSLTMIGAIKNSVKYAGISLDEALRMATLYPAQALGVDDYLGTISINKIANLTIFTDEYKINKTIVNGKEIKIKKH
ncbi:N-acetylglucosamine-6-phosphate deacetylase [Blochmannia endosymbiont of Camponotus (Colobopsis) obliquus]|uniref:N-acetylglucosamine-6-phosphate deacetylase n=1 Tax=Blochmannia endosymbiont of Camponotus (Colobopsis) obliquus TaxID=1505597 RepID=UPI00061A87EF|nr:N-acetylglucosamine-6-phosphate deacetylase [Blochmannia endosymbiont of Camponotus (Colobopsis) obliquus]AKC60485.1 N-acetylglucosamine-6-phosphate deacetylase [Blochmannia endosymbiont of Camponotus (Colobopsis) obliquus]